MRVVTLALVVLLSVWLQVSFLGAARPLGVLPNLLLVVVIYAGLAATATEAVAMALGGGILLDVVSGTDFGLRMGFYSLLALVIIMIKRAGANFDNIGLVLLSTIGGTVAYNAAVITGLMLAGASLPVSVGAVRVGLETVINLILVLLAGRLLVRLFKAGGMKQELGR
ncbi:MAG TPA: hypothetical protein VK963_03805 [Candidatus Saccharimonadales bacterium]|nr:hypothetical protein [Candidatus Saccharimonadales bacterium]